MRGARLGMALLLGGAVVVGGLTLERELGPRPLRAADVPDVISGAWFCPHGGAETWRTWVVVANPTAEEVRARMVTYGSGRPAARSVSVAAWTQRYLEVPATDMGAGSAVEFFGGPVTAAMVTQRPDGRGLGAEPCVHGSATRWHLADGTTLRGFGQWVVVMNPFGGRAVFDISLTDEEETRRPSEMSGVVLPARRAVAFDLNEFALGKPTLAATVEVALGSVAVGGIGVSEGGLRTTLPAPESASTWILPGGGDAGTSELAAYAPGDREAPLRVRAQEAAVQREVLAYASVDAQRSATFRVEAQDAGLVVEAAGREPFVAARRLATRADLAGTAGVTAGATAWVAMPATAPKGGRAILIVQNAGEEIAEARLVLLTATGRAEAPSIADLVLSPGRTHLIPLADLVGEEPVSVLVEVERGALVVAQAGLSADGYAVALGASIGPLR